MDQSFLYFAKIFVHLPVIEACYFSVYKLIGWDPLNQYLCKVISRNGRKRCGIYPKLTINTVESRSGVLFFFLLTLSIFHNFLLFLLSNLNRSVFFLCKYYLPKPKDGQMLDLTLFKVAADFLNS